MGLKSAFSSLFMSSGRVPEVIFDMLERLEGKDTAVPAATPETVHVKPLLRPRSGDAPGDRAGWWWN
jgi:hypothetical protein